MGAVEEVIPAAHLYTKCKAILSPHQHADACAEKASEVFLTMLVTVWWETTAVWGEAGRRAKKHLVTLLAYAKIRNVFYSILEKMILWV